MQAMLQVRQTHLASAPIGAWEVKLEFFTDQQTDQHWDWGRRSVSAIEMLRIKNKKPQRQVKQDRLLFLPLSFNKISKIGLQDVDEGIRKEGGRLKF